MRGEVYHVSCNCSLTHHFYPHLSLFINNNNKCNSGSPHVTVRIANLGSRNDKKGGEAALLASTLNGTVGREYISISSLKPFLPTSSEHLEQLKQAQLSRVANASFTAQMMDQLHGTAFQIAPKGDSLGNALEGTKETIASLTADDVASLLGGIDGSSVTVVGTGNGDHAKLVEEVEKVLGGVKSASGSGKEVAAAGEKSAFIGSDIRCAFCFVL